MSVVAGVRGPYRKGVERRRQVVDAASVLFARRGYAAASLREIAAEVGASPTSLLRLFGRKEDLLLAVLERWEVDTHLLLSRVDMGEGLHFFAAFPQLMRYHVEHPGLIELFLTMCTEASDPQHPAREWVAQRYAQIVAQGVEHLRTAQADGRVRPMTPTECEVEVRALYAAMDGLELQWIAAPELDLVALSDELFAQTFSRWTGRRFVLPTDRGARRVGESARRRSAVAPRPLVAPEADRGVRGPYRTGVERRRQIVEQATRVFAVRGYTNASLREIAGGVGVTGAALLRYFGSKEELLFAVLDRFDADSGPTRVFHRTADGRAFFDALVDVMEQHRERRGLIELLLTLGTEATDPDHPARGWVADRYDRIVAEAARAIAAVQDRGRGAPTTSARHADEARRYFAVMDGLELQWLVDPDLDIAATFRAWHRSTVQRWVAG
ncbi:TetR/AcrR family transcriptional regulator [Kineococcus sp. TBRC 1896]|uniref:TetR/AcrR family transcriptional regulator n=1 Tax=Kineococcus mangrovi TaxID=1660183 RepID=A0ABV4I6T1_9ACTN